MFRRVFFLFIILFSFVFADSGDFIKNIVSTTNSFLGEKNGEEKYLEYIRNNIDMNFVSNFILGSNGKNLTDTDKNEFKNLYSKYLLNNYMSKLKDYSKDLRVSKVIDKGNNVFLVETITKDKSGININVTFRITKNDNYMITDIIAEGVSFIGALRTDVNSSIQRNGFKKFMEELRIRSK